MKTLITTVAATLLAISFTLPATALTKQEARQHMADRKAACKDQAAQKISAIHFLQRRKFVNNCMAHATQAKVVKTHHVKAVKTMPTTTGQSVK
jgi:hypothetical protein